jgi:hypothetical protein
MAKSKSRKKRAPKRVLLALPDLEHAKTAVLNSLTSASGQRTYEHAIREFVTWYCSEPRLAFNRTWCFDTGFTSSNVDTRRPRLIFAWPPFGASRTRRRTPVFSVPNWRPVFVG